MGCFVNGNAVDCGQVLPSGSAAACGTLVGERKLPIADYHAPSADLAWRRTLEFFDRHLK